jgi:hypothetical protein
MVIVRGAFVAQHAQEQIGGEGSLLIEKAGLPRAQIGADGNTEVLALVVVIQSDLEERETEEGQQLIVDLRYPWGGEKGGIERDWRVLDIHPASYTSEVRLIFFDFTIDSNYEGRHQFDVSCNGSTVSVPLVLFKDP